MRRSLLASGLLALLIGTLAGCSKSEPAALEQPPEPESSEAQSPAGELPPAREAPPGNTGVELIDKAEFKETPAEHMRDHFGVVEQARDALIRADLQAAEGPLTWLSQHRFAGEVPEPWAPHVAEMQDHARAALATSQLDQVAGQVVALAAACGDCHTALSHVPSLPPAGFEDLDEQASESVRKRMHRHLWAVERMWEALVLPEPDRFRMAGEVLQESRLLDTDSPEVEAGVARVKALGARAAAATTQQARQAVLTDFLSACAGCHKRVGINRSVLR